MRTDAVVSLIGPRHSLVTIGGQLVRTKCFLSWALAYHRLHLLKA